MAATRDITVQTKLQDAFVFRHLHGREALSELFDYHVELLSENDAIKLEDILGTPITLTMQLQDGGERHFHGHVIQFIYTGTEGSYACYHACVRPWLWFLTMTTDCRIFQNLSVPDIAEQIFKKHPSAAYSLMLKEPHPVREYCVQYNESDLTFVNRLFEDEGIFYFFEHKSGEHKLIVTDSDQAYTQRAGYKDVPFYPRDDQSRRERDHLYDWQSVLDVRPGRFIQTSFDFEKPKAELETRRLAPLPHAQSDGEIYCYPACYTVVDDGNHLAQIRLEESQAAHKRMRGAGTVAGLGCGQTFSLTNYPRKDQNAKYQVLAVEHEIWSDAYRTGSSGGEEEPYLCTIAVQPSAVPFRPPLATPKPVMAGPESAIVTGPAGEEIWTDKYGRVKVQFPWDRLGKNDENSSCWVRVSQAWAGGGFGGIHIPRIGQEVLIEFLQGDVDRPIITGRVYDGTNMPPYELPANATQSGIKSDSSKGGGGSNELRFEDKKGQEQVYLHAQKNEDIVVENDKTEKVGHDETIQIANDRTEQVGKNETLSVGVDRTRNVGSNETVTIGANRVDTVALNEARTVGIAQQQTVGAARNVTVGATQAHEVGLNDTWLVGMNRTTDIGRNDNTSIGNNRGVDVGDNDTLDVGKELTISVGDQITLKTGKAVLVMKKDGTISLNGKDISVDGSGKINITAKGNITQKGQKILQN
jgi:type VI secretion system secreted protein VgrG